MLRTSRVMRLGLLSLFAAGLLLSTTGCTKYASEDDKAQLSEAKAAALAAEDALRAKNNEKAELAQELSQLQAELDAAQQELEHVQAAQLPQGN